MKVLLLLLLLTAMTAVNANAQRPRAVDPGATQTTAPRVAPAPQTVKAKYEGGVFGHNKTMEGTLSFDDNGDRLVFKNKEQKEVLFIPYGAVTSAFADTQKRQPAAATVASNVPLIYALPAHFIKTKVRYLTLNFNDPDTHVSGITSFRMENKEILASVLQTLAEKTGMFARGDGYIKKKPTDSNP
jgi:hypothetical protein